MEDRMNCKRVWVCAALLLVCTASVFAQEQSNEIRCSGSSSTCKSGFIPKYASNGGSATVNDSIMSQSGTSITVAGNATATGNVTGAFVEGSSSTGTGVEGFTNASGATGVYGESDGTSGVGVFGKNPSGFEGVGVAGQAGGSEGIGVFGETDLCGNVCFSILGTAPIGVIGDSTSGYAMVATSDSSNALLAETGSSDTNDTAVIINLGGGFPLFLGAKSGSMFLDGGGNLNVSGAIFAGTKDFKIDHPLDPENKYLYHASVESSEMMNIYTGTTLMDMSGSAIVSLPDWFEAVNGQFRYQLTAIGAPAPNLHIAREISHNQFVIGGGQPGMKVSWQVTGVRHDAYAKAHPLKASVAKPEGERGYYLHPELYGAPMEKRLGSAHYAQVVQHGNAR
jgi:hypothetical protein